MKIRLISNIFLVLLWGATFVLSLIWIFYSTPPFEPEPVTAALGLIATALTVLTTKFSDALKKEEFSTANALAYGYVNNFVEPVINAIIKSNKNIESKPILHIYIPGKLDELLPKNIDRILAKIREQKYTDETIKLELPEGRGARDILTISKMKDKIIYFDFPSTLLTLKSLIDFKTESKKDSFDNDYKIKLAGEYIKKFKSSITSIITEKNLTEYIRFTDSKLIITL